MSDNRFSTHGGPDVPAVSVSPLVAPLSVTTLDLLASAAKDSAAVPELGLMSSRLAGMAMNPVLRAAGMVDPSGAARVSGALLSAGAGPSGTVASAVRVTGHVGLVTRAAGEYELTEGRNRQLVNDLAHDYQAVKLTMAQDLVELDLLNLAVDWGLNLRPIMIKEHGVPIITADYAGALNQAFAQDPDRQERLLSTLGFVLNGVGWKLGMAGPNDGQQAAKVVYLLGLVSGQFKRQQAVFDRQRLTAVPTPPAANAQQLFTGLDRAAKAPGKDDDYQQTASVMVRKVVKNGQASFVVYLPPTQRKDADPTYVTNMATNAALGAGVDNAALQMAKDAMARAGIPPGAPVMLLGYSQGGLAAARLTSDPAFRQRYNVKALMTAGSPLGEAGKGVPPNIARLSLESGSELVTALDKAKNPDGPNQATLTFEAKGRSALDRHDYSLYVERIGQTENTANLDTKTRLVVEQFNRATTDFTGGEVTSDEFTYTSKAVS